MTGARVMGYCDRWSVAPGDTVRFMVSCLDADRYDVAIVRLKQPDAGPLATPFAPEPVAAPCNGPRRGRAQAIPAGSLAVVPAHPALAAAGSFTLAAYVFATTPTKGRQALLGTWCEADQTGYGLELDATGAVTVRLGAGAGQVAMLSTGVPLSRRRWYRVAAAIDAERGTATVWQEPLDGHDFTPEAPICVTGGAGIRAPVTARPLQRPDRSAASGARLARPRRHRRPARRRAAGGAVGAGDRRLGFRPRHPR